MKVVILAGGLGTRMSEYTKTIPKPMVKVNKKPIIFHIMKHYYSYGYNEFIVAGGYKSLIIKNYFDKYKFNWKTHVINTGLNTMTGGRLKRLKEYIGNETFMMTYGDGISNVNIRKLVSFHNKNNKIMTLTAVRPPARFGALKIAGNFVQYFKEKSQIDEGWINGGFFVIKPEIFKFIKNDNTIFEKEPIEKLTKINQLIAYKHKSFWQCLDTKRDVDLLNLKIKKI